MSIQVKNNNENIVPEAPFKHFETLWLQVGGTLCNLECTHCFISCGPKNDTIPMMTLSQVKERLKESKSLKSISKLFTLTIALLILNVILIPILLFV